MGVGETWRRLLAKCVLKVSGQESKEACGTDQVCGRMEDGIEVSTHAMRILWQKNPQEEEWGFNH